MTASVKTRANTLLAGVGAVALASYPWSAASTAIDFVHHAALAATIGGLADWWGVTAIFARPLGVAAPGTDMLRERYDELKEVLVAFVCDDVLAPAQLLQVLAEERLAKAIAEHFSEPKQAAAAWNALQPLVREVLQRLNTKEAEQLLLDEVPRYLPSLNLPDILLDVAQRAISRRQLDGVWRLLAEQGRRLVRSAEFTGLLQDMAHRADLRYTQNSLLRDLFAGGLLEEHIPEQCRRFLDGKLDELTDAGSELRRMLDNLLLTKLEELRRDIAFRNWINDRAALFVTQQAHFLKDGLCRTDAEWLRALAEKQVAELAASEEKQARLDARLRLFLQSALEGNRGSLRELVTRQLERFERDEVIDLLRTRVGDDLQNIRISGTLIGGLLGAALFIMELMAERLVG